MRYPEELELEKKRDEFRLRWISNALQKNQSRIEEELAPEDGALHDWDFQYFIYLTLFKTRWTKRMEEIQIRFS